MSTASRSPSSWRRSGSSALGLDGLDRGLAARLGALGTGDRSASPRQQTLDGAIDWSYQLLSEPERLLWARLSVFAGGFELDAAQAVCAGDGLDAADIPELVGSLVEQSVVKRRRQDAADRFRLLEPLRQFGRERLREAGRRTHAALSAQGLDRRSRAARLPPKMSARSSSSSESGPSAPTSGPPSTSVSRIPSRPSAALRSAATCGSTGRLRDRSAMFGASWLRCSGRSPPSPQRVPAQC